MGEDINNRALVTTMPNNIAPSYAPSYSTFVIVLSLMVILDENDGTTFDHVVRLLLHEDQRMKNFDVSHGGGEQAYASR